MSKPTSSAKHVFISEQEVIRALSFSFAPSLLGECEQTKKDIEVFEFTPCYDPKGEFLGYAIEKKLVKQ